MSIATQEQDPLLAQGIRIHSEAGSINFRRNRLLVGTGAVLASVVIAVGCGNDEPDIGGVDGTLTNVPTAISETEPATVPVCNPSVETCYSYEDMDDLAELAVSTVVPFLAETYVDIQEPAYRYIPAGTVEPSTCGEITSQDFAYCPSNQTVYIGQDGAWSIYSGGGGDSGVALGVSHEVGHHLQTVAGVPDPLTSRELIPFENQADCVAGAWVSHANNSGIFVEGDFEGMDRTLELIASVEGEERDHGTLSERLEAVQIGVNGGVVACNDFNSRYPLITFN